MAFKIGLLTGGGECGGLNAMIESVYEAATRKGWEVCGIKKGWEGAIQYDIYPLSLSLVEDINFKTGTLLQTSRKSPFKYSGKVGGRTYRDFDISRLVMDNLKRAEIDALIVGGGDDTLSVIDKLIEQYGDEIKMVGIPKTMDGDLQAYSLGLDTAINEATKELRDFKQTLIANGSIGVVEFFGRDVGRVTFKAGIAGGADVILIPEVPIDLDYLCDFIANKYYERGIRHPLRNSYALIAIAEGTFNPITGKRVYLKKGKDSFGHGKLGGVGDKIAKLVVDRLYDDPRIKKINNYLDAKTLSPTYGIRSGATSATDSYLGQKLGVAAVQYIELNGDSGMAIADLNKDSEIVVMPIKELIKPRPVHEGALLAFEKSGMYCFGRPIDSEVYNPTIKMLQ